MPPTFTFAIPTHREDRPLKRCLESVKYQLEAGDEVLVIGDTFNGELPAVQSLVESYGSQYRYLPYDAGHSCWGHCQLNYAMSVAKGQYWHVNDDDDIYLPGATEMMRQAANAWPGRLLMFRFISQFGTIYWEQVGKVERNSIGGHCLVAPLISSKMGMFACVYSGDYDYVAHTVAMFGGPREAIWIDNVICRARPPG